MQGDTQGCDEQGLKGAHQLAGAVAKCFMAAFNVAGEAINKSRQAVTEVGDVMTTVDSL